MTSLPEKIGKYQIISILGQGGMGIVYKAVDPDISEQVALKVIRPELLKNDNDDTLLKRFRNEVKACRLLKHPNIVATYAYHEIHNECYIVMEYVEGEELSSYLKNDRVFDFGTIYKIIKQLLSVLEYAHEQGVIHRDIKPDNILINEEGNIHVMDFGIARMETSTLTKAGAIMGSPGYMSPEQCLGKQVDNRSDLFSAGVVLYQLITNERAFSGDNPMSTMQKILNVDPVKPSLLNNNIPSSFDLVINKALAKAPKNRYQSAKEFMDDIEEFYIHYLKPNEKKSKSKIGIMSAGIAALAIGGGYLYFQNQASKTEKEAIAPLVVPNDKESIVTPVQQTPDPVKTEAPTELIIDNLRAKFDDFECHTLQIEKNPDNKIIITGSAQSSDFISLNQLLESQLVGQNYSNSATKLDKPFCVAVSQLSKGIALNQSTGKELNIQPYSHSKTYVTDELIMFEMITPSETAYIYVDYFTSGGSVVHLYPSSDIENQPIEGPNSFILGDKDVQWEVTEPYGTDLITIISSTKALFETVRPNVENTEEYLQILNSLLSSEQPSLKADYFLLTTTDKNN